MELIELKYMVEKFNYTNRENVKKQLYILFLYKFVQV